MILLEFLRYAFMIISIIYIIYQSLNMFVNNYSFFNIFVSLLVAALLSIEIGLNVKEIISPAIWGIMNVFLVILLFFWLSSLGEYER